ncbi:MAG: DUF1801 domain-containing protein [Phycisphaerales bacterium]
MQSKAATVREYLAELPPDRRESLEKVRKVILANLDKDYQEGMGYGMMGYSVPHSVYPAGYHCNPEQPLPFAGLASQKGHMSLYLMCLYADSDHAKWFQEAWKKTGKKLDMGKSCIRFKHADELALDVIGQSIKRVPAKKYIAVYESMLAGAKRPASKAKAAKKAPAKKKTKKKPA